MKQRQFQSHGIALEHIAARAGDAHPALDVEHAQILHQLDVAKRHEIKRRWRADALDLDILTLIHPRRHALVGNIGHAQQQVAQFVVEIAQLWLQLFQFGGDGAASLDGRLAGRFVRPRRLNLFRDLVLLGAILFHLLAQIAQPQIEREQRVDVDVDTFAPRRVFDDIWVRANEREIEHMKASPFGSIKKTAARPHQDEQRMHRLSWCHLSCRKIRNTDRLTGEHESF